MFVWGPDGKKKQANVFVVETPGRWYFPPAAAAVTALGRLMLHIGKAAVEVRGGSVAYADTDGLDVVSTPYGELIACPGGKHQTLSLAAAVLALSYAEVEDVRAQIEMFSPYPQDVRPSGYVWVEEPGAGYTLEQRRPRTYPRRIHLPRLLKLEPENFAGGPAWPAQAHVRVFASKRYCIYHVTRRGLSFAMREGLTHPDGTHPRSASELD